MKAGITWNPLELLDIVFQNIHDTFHVTFWGFPVVTRAFQKLTAKDVEKALKGKLPDGRHADGQGLSMVVRGGGGAASWVLVHNPPKPAKQRQITIGSVRKLGTASGSIDPYQQAAHSLKEARIQAASIRDNIAKGVPAKLAPVKEERTTFADILDYYLTQKGIERRKVSKYIATYETLLAKREGVFDRALSLEYRDTLLKTISPSTAKTYIKMLAAMFELWITDKEASFKNPFTRLNVEDSETDVSRREPMPVNIVKAVRSKLESDEDRLIWDVLATTGARLGEIVGLKSTDVKAGFIRIETNSKRTIKNKSSKRVIPCFVNLPKNDTEFYFRAEVGPTTWRFAQAIRSVTRDRKITSHSLRHAMTDVLRDGRVEMLAEDFFLGHAPHSVAAKSYGSFEARAKYVESAVAEAVIAYAERLGLPAYRYSKHGEITSLDFEYE